VAQDEAHGLAFNPSTSSIALACDRREFPAPTLAQSHIWRAHWRPLHSRFYALRPRATIVTDHRSYALSIRPRFPCRRRAVSGEASRSGSDRKTGVPQPWPDH
jgi:hypothetical protein